MVATLITILPLLILCFAFPSPTKSSSNQTDQISLLAIKSSLQDPQGSLSSWNQTLSFCNWTGIQCGGRHRDRVVTIDLSSQALVGNLSPYIGNLSFLKTIILRNNTFQGPIPTEITRLPRLEFLELSNNSFVGAIPTNLSNCRNLVRLHLIKNLLSGTIPSELGLLSKLEDLALSRNNFTGGIPPTIGNITTLTRLSFVSSGLAGELPESLGRLHRLKTLQLSENSLTGSIPSSLYNLSSITYFDVSSNQLHGVIPSTIGLTLSNLEYLNLGQNYFSGQIPISISNASMIEGIDLSSNRFTGPIPSVGGLNQIQELLLDSNLIEDDVSFISSLTNSTMLQSLDLSDNFFTGYLPNSIANLSITLNYLYLGKNKIYGNIPLGIGDLINLVELDLSNNFLDGPFPPVISKLYNLFSLVLANNRLTGEIVSSFGNLTLLSRLHLDGNRISGNVPSSLGNCTNLLEIDLSDNNFNGLIPLQVMNLPSVSIVFNLSHNALVGSIPHEIGSLENLAALDLSSNRLSGIIPNDITNCASLEVLHLDDNLLQGEVPSGLSALMGLQDLDLSKNNLSGSIPEFLANMKIVKLNLSFNKLHGEVPMKGVFLNKTLVSLDGNEGLCGGVTDLKLPPCPGGESPKKNFIILLKILIPSLVIVGLCLMLVVIILYKRRILTTNRISFMFSNGVQFMRLSYSDLRKATSGFSESNLVGFGRFGSVYKGVLDDGTTLVAVKVVNLDVGGASKTFMAECKALGGLRHRNLVKLLSVCDGVDFQGNNFKALVYEFKVNGSLEKWLHVEEGGGSYRKLSIMERLNIAIDIAQGIKYLHFGTSSCIVHGDLKPSNILLDQNLVACVSDFGLARIVSNNLASWGTNSSSLGIKGTFGYIPPEYGMCDVVSVQGDVYSFGIILLEMFTKKRPTDDVFDDHLNLHNYVSMALPDRVMEIVGPEFQTEPNFENVKECLICILSIGVSCSKEISKDRMSINDAVNGLCHIKELFCLDV